MSEKNIKNSIRLFLSMFFGVCIFNNPVGKFLSKDLKRWITAGLGKGSPDLCGWRSIVITAEMVGQRIAVFVGIETKTPVNSLSPLQKIWLARLEKDGALSGVARCDADAEKIIRRLEGKELTNFFVRMSPDLHEELAKKAKEEGVSLNAYVACVLAAKAPKWAAQENKRLSVEGFEPFFAVTEDAQEA